MAETVVLLHGLGRTARSMAPMSKALQRSGFETHLVGYPSRVQGIADLIGQTLAPEVDRLLEAGAERVHFVTHSLGGILVRAFAAERYDAGHPLPAGSRAVMLAPPHGGSPVAEALLSSPRLWPGPALGELGLGDASIGQRLGPIRGLEVGVVAGTRRIIPTGRFFDGPHDGLVSVESAFAAEGIADTVVVARTHALMMQAPDVIRLTQTFLETGRFAQP